MFCEHRFTIVDEIDGYTQRRFNFNRLSLPRSRSIHLRSRPIMAEIDQYAQKLEEVIARKKEK